jgi:hypothetical protein
VLSSAASIPAEYVQRVLSHLVPSSTGTVTGVTWHGAAKPATIAISRTWKTEPAKAAVPAVIHETMPFSVLRSGCGGVELLECWTCERLFAHVRG